VNWWRLTWPGSTLGRVEEKKEVNWWRLTWHGSTLRRVRGEERGELVAIDMAWVDFETGEGRRKK
jgi:hypothetical protein